MLILHAKIPEGLPLKFVGNYLCQSSHWIIVIHWCCWHQGASERVFYRERMVWHLLAEELQVL